MAQVTNQPARTARQRYVRECLLTIQATERNARRKDNGNQRARFSYTEAAAIVAVAVDRGISTVKIWASIDPRDIPNPELEKLKTLMRKHYCEQSSQTA